MLVVFSGLDGAGKSTQIDLLLAWLRAQGQDPVYLWARGGYTPLFNALKSILRRASGGRVVPDSGPSTARTQAFRQPWKRRLWLRLALLDLLLVYVLQVRWWLWRGRPVICDRYVGDTLLDFRLNFPQEQVERWPLWRALVKLAPQANAAFLLLIPVAESVRRSQLKDEPFPDPPEILAQRLAQYQSLAESSDWQVLDGRSPISDLAHTIRRRVAQATNPAVLSDAY